MLRRSLLSALALALAAVAPDVDAAAPAHASASASARVTGEVTVRKGSLTGPLKDDRSGVVVYLDFEPDPEHPLAAAAAAAPPAQRVHQIDKSFRPTISAVVVGTEISFPNDDKIFHNVFSLSKTRRFDLGLYKSGTTRSVTVDRPGVIDVYCNIHPEMWAKVVVVPNRLFAVTGPDGRFELKGVPPGTYPFVAWHAGGEPTEGEVTVPPGGAANLQITVVDTPQSTLHTRKDGTPYGRYQ